MMDNMDKYQNPWDALPSTFDTDKSENELDPNVADNVLIGWPSLLASIATIQKTGQGLRALDFGCGTGGLCQELLMRSYSVVGCDQSAGMVAAAKKRIGDRAEIFVAEHEDLRIAKSHTLNMRLKGLAVPVFIRKSPEYGRILENFGYQLKAEDYPPFTEPFLKRYPLTENTSASEYMVLVYQKVIKSKPLG